MVKRNKSRYSSTGAVANLGQIVVGNTTDINQLARWQAFGAAASSVHSSIPGLLGSQVDARNFASELVSHLTDDLVTLVVMRVGATPDPLHVVSQDGPTEPDVEPGHQRLLELAAGQQVADGDLVSGDELLAAVLEPDGLDLEFCIKDRSLFVGCLVVSCQLLKNLFCSTSMPITSTRWVRLAFLSLCPLYSKQRPGTSKNS